MPSHLGVFGMLDAERSGPYLSSENKMITDKDGSMKELLAIRRIFSLVDMIFKLP